MDETRRREIGRRTFLKLGVAGLAASALMFLSGCAGEEEDDEDGDEEDDEDGGVY
jgi:hypothetical protein